MASLLYETTSSCAREKEEKRETKKMRIVRSLILPLPVRSFL